MLLSVAQKLNLFFLINVLSLHSYTVALLIPNKFKAYIKIKIKTKINKLIGVTGIKEITRELIKGGMFLRSISGININRNLVIAWLNNGSMYIIMIKKKLNCCFYYMIFELALILYILIAWYVYNNFPEYINKYSNLLPVVACLSYYIIISLASYYPS